MRRIVLTLLLTLPVLLSPLPVSAQDVQYEIRNLIRAHDLESEASGLGAYAISDEGVVVGFTGQSPTKSSPFVTVDGKPTRLRGGGEFGATAGDVNSAGVVVGRNVSGKTETGVGFIGMPVMWVDGEMIQLELPLDPFGQAAITGVARSINDAGLIVGEAQYPGEINQYVVVWNEGVPSFLPDAFGYPYCAAFGLSEAGLIAGNCFDPATGLIMPVIWEGFSAMPLFDLPHPNIELTSIVDTPGGYAAGGFGYGTDEAGAPTDSSGVVVVNGEVRDLPAPADNPFCLVWSVSQTDAGLLAGGTCFADISLFSRTGYGERVAAAWLDGELIDLESAIDAKGWTLFWVRGTNSEGQMVGLGERNGERRSFVLTPVS